ncbi:unnamed protein product [Prorocentrum cordatum]|uniref:Chitin-binding type-2 domain-containing protein n=1 Tax=Prorocentrum cordatum TaxID=2364126 RepID=A0ABN9VS09_9DINO|nr:unnamed protein product [Polarella glacialis]
MQALEYIQFVTCSRLQVATQHIFAVLQELEACASWSQKFGGIGLEPGPVGRLLSDARDFLRLTELLLLECSQARRFARTLLQVLLRVSRSLPDQSGAPPETGAAVPAREDMDDFVDRMRGRQPLDLPEVAARIGLAAAPAGCSSAAAGAASGAADGAEGAGARPTCLAGALGRLAAAAEELSGRVVTAVSCQAAVMACLPVSAAPPWASMAAPEFRAVAHSDAAAGRPPMRAPSSPLAALAAALLVARASGARYAAAADVGPERGGSADALGGEPVALEGYAATPRASCGAWTQDQGKIVGDVVTECRKLCEIKKDCECFEITTTRCRIAQRVGRKVKKASLSSSVAYVRNAGYTNPDIECHEGDMMSVNGSCQEYQTCKGGRFASERCAHDLAYSPARGRCDWPALVPTCAREGLGDKALPAVKCGRGSFLLASDSSPGMQDRWRPKGAAKRCYDVVYA